jgi:hypothetical protein
MEFYGRFSGPAWKINTLRLFTDLQLLSRVEAEFRHFRAEGHFRAGSGELRRLRNLHKKEAVWVFVSMGIHSGMNSGAADFYTFGDLNHGLLRHSNHLRVSGASSISAVSWPMDQRPNQFRLRFDR